MREIVLDTETTGLDALRGDRLVEVGCVELFNRMPTGQTFHRYINPEREMSTDAFTVHGLSTQFLADKPFFHEAVEEFLAFIGDAPRTPGAPRQVIIFIFTWSPSRFWPRAEAKRDGELPRQFSLYTIASLVLPRRLNCRLLALAYSPVCVFLASQ